MPAAPSARLFQLHRDEDASGVSGTGVVAEGVEFTSGLVAITWLSPHRGVTIYESIRTVEQVHGHEERTRVVFLDHKAVPGRRRSTPK